MSALLQRRDSGGKKQSCSAELITRDMFPPGGAGDYTYAEAIEAYGAQNVFREPRKTFRLTVSTTFYFLLHEKSSQFL
jgi:outer membrane protein insertion porin family